MLPSQSNAVPVTALTALESSSADVEGGKDEFVEWHGEACALEKRRKGNPKKFFEVVCKRLLRLKGGGQ